MNNNVIEFIPLYELDKELQILVLSWRNDSRIRIWMTNSNIIDLESHFSFIDSLKNNSHSYYWMVLRKNKPLAVVYLHIKPYDTSTAEWGYYLSPNFLGSGYGLEVGFHAIQMFFTKFLLEKLIGKIKEDNNENYRIQTALGFQKLSKIDGYFITVLYKNVYKNFPSNFIDYRKTLFKYERKSTGNN